MFARLFKTLHLSRGQKAVAIAYGGVMAVSSGITLMLMSAMEGAYAIPPEPTLYDNWVIVAGGIASGVALYMSRAWMGRRGALGFARAIVAAIIVTFVTAIIAGTLVSPFYGTLVGPFVLVSEFMAKPLLAVAWFVVLFGAHFLIAILRAEEEWTRTSKAVSHLSSLSQANLYRHTYRH